MKKLKCDSLRQELGVGQYLQCSTVPLITIFCLFYFITTAWSMHGSLVFSPCYTVAMERSVILYLDLK